MNHKFGTVIKRFDIKQVFISYLVYSKVKPKL